MVDAGCLLFDGQTERRCGCGLAVIAGHEDDRLSVREAEAIVRHHTEKPVVRSPKDSKDETILDPNVRAALDEMAMALGTKVRLSPRGPSSGIRPLG